MANTNAPFGLRWLGLTGGSAAPTASQVIARIAYNNTQAIYEGDPVMMLATGYIDQWDAGTAVSQLWGTFVGCEYQGSNGSWTRGNYWPGGGNAGTADVIAHIVPGILSVPSLYVIQTDATGVTQADVGANFDFDVANGSAYTGMSGFVLNASAGAAVTATLPMRLMGLWSNWNSVSSGTPNVGPGTEAGAYNWAVVSLNSGAGTTGLTS
jgi:hypothetical protein